MTSESTVRFERREDGVRVLTLDDPGKRNAIGPQMRDELIEIHALLAADEDVRCLVVTGAGVSFCAGADLLAIFEGEGTDALPAAMRRRQLAYYDSFLWLRDLPFPTVAAVNGHAIGAGLNLALACDIVMAGPGARFGATFARIGLHPGGGCTYFVTERLGRGRALRTLLLGEIVDGAEAFATGLVDELADDVLETALSFAEHVARLDPNLAQDMKRTVSIAATETFETVLTVESWAQASSAHHPGVMEGIRRAGRSTQSRGVPQQ